MTLVYGKLSDIHGRATMISFAIAIFVGASLLCALAQNMGELVAARALQGIGAGGLPVMAQAMVGDIVPPRERGRYQSIVSIVFAVATTSGPAAGRFSGRLRLALVLLDQPAARSLAFVLVRRVAARIPRGHGVHRIDVRRALAAHRRRGCVLADLQLGRNRVSVALDADRRSRPGCRRRAVRRAGVAAAPLERADLPRADLREDRDPLVRRDELADGGAAVRGDRAGPGVFAARLRSESGGIGVADHPALRRDDGRFDASPGK